jgi:capsid protein
MASLTASVRRAELSARQAEANAKAAAWQQIQNSFKGGVPTRTDEAWTSASTFRFNSQEERSNVQSMRDRAYQAYKNNPVAQTLVETEADNVIGDGLNYQPTTDDEGFNREASDKYYEWLENASVRGRDMQDGCSLEWMLWTNSRVAGDVGWILVSRGSDSYIQIVPSENIVTPDNMWSDPNVVDGVRFDEFGKPVLYYVLRQAELGVTRTFTPIPAKDFRFLPHMKFTNQSRGVSCFSTVLPLLAHLDRYIDGVSLAAWMATVIGIIFKQNNAAKQMAGLGSLTNSSGDQQKGLIFENGMFKFMNTGEDVIQVDAKQPMQQTPQFIVTLMRLLGQPFHMPLAVVFKDTSQENFASARIGLNPFYRHCRIQAQRFGYRWSSTIQWWLSRERKRADDDPNKWTSTWPEKFWNHELLVNEWDYQDPISEAQGDQIQMDMKTKSPQMVIKGRGRDPKRILKEWEEWRKITADLPETRSNLTRDPAPEPQEPAADPNAPDPELERIKAEADAYGVAVRAGVVTPQTDDEGAFREKLSLPPMGADAKKAWKEDKGVRRPITLTPPGGQPAPGFGQPKPPDQGDNNNGDSKPTE